MSTRNRDLDPIDRKILSLLIHDGRISLAEIGKRVALSSPAVKHRVHRLESEGTIRGYSAVVDQVAFGWHTEAFLEVFCERDTSLEALRRTLTDHPEVIGAYTVAGDPEAILHVRTVDIAHLEQTIERIRSQPNVVRTKTQVVLTTLIERQGPLERA